MTRLRDALVRLVLFGAVVYLTLCALIGNFVLITSIARWLDLTPL